MNVTVNAHPKPADEVEVKVYVPDDGRDPYLMMKIAGLVVFPPSADWAVALSTQLMNAAVKLQLMTEAESPDTTVVAV